MITGASGGTNAATVLRCTTGSQPASSAWPTTLRVPVTFCSRTGTCPPLVTPMAAAAWMAPSQPSSADGDRRCVEDVALPQLDVAVGEAALAEHPARLRRVADEGDDLVAGGQQRGRRPRPDEPAGPGEQDPHARMMPDRSLAPMHARSRLLLCSLAAAALVLGCSDDEPEIDEDADQELVEDVALTLDDLPDGFEEVRPRTTTTTPSDDFEGCERRGRARPARRCEDNKVAEVGDEVSFVLEDDELLHQGEPRWLTFRDADLATSQLEAFEDDDFFDCVTDELEDRDQRGRRRGQRVHHRHDRRRPSTATPPRRWPSGSSRSGIPLRDADAHGAGRPLRLHRPGARRAPTASTRTWSRTSSTP